MHGYLSQKLGSDGHFEVSNLSKTKMVQHNYNKNNFPFFESFTLTKIRIELSCYLTNLAKSGPEKKCFVSFASKSIFWFRHAKNCFTKNLFLNSFHKNKKNPRV